MDKTAKKVLYCRHLIFSHSLLGRLCGPGSLWPGQRKNSSGIGIKQRIFLILTLLTVVGLIGCQSEKEGAGTNAEAKTGSQAREALAAQDWEQAITLYDQALTESPNEIESLYGRASAQLARGWEFYRKAQDAAEAELYDQVETAGKNADERFQRAEEDCRAILAVDPDYAGAHYALGCIALYQGDWESAIADFTTVIRLEPENRFAYQRRGEVFGHIGDTVSEESDLKRAAELGYRSEESPAEEPQEDHSSEKSDKSEGSASESASEPVLNDANSKETP